MNASAATSASSAATASTTASAWQALRTRLSANWQRLNSRERWAVTTAAVVCASAALWWGALAPALATLRQAPQRHAQLDDQLAHMRTLSAVATRLQALPALGRTERLAALEADTRRLLGDTATVRTTNDQATVTLRATRPEALAQWLADVRANARLTPTEARLSRQATAGPPTPPGTPGPLPTAPPPRPPTSAPSPASTGMAWQGEVVFALGADAGR